MAWRTEADQTNCRMNNGMGKLCSEWRSSCFLWGFGTEVPLIKIASVCVCMRTEMETDRARTDRRISLQSPWNPDCFAHPNITRKKDVTSLWLEEGLLCLHSSRKTGLNGPWRTSVKAGSWNPAPTTVSFYSAHGILGRTRTKLEIHMGLPRSLANVCSGNLWQKDNFFFGGQGGYLFIYLTVLGLNCSMWTLSYGLWGLGPQPEVEPGPPALEAQSLSLWTTRKSQKTTSFA